MSTTSQKGMTLAEVLVSIGIVAILIFATVTVSTTAVTQTKRNMDRQFATQKAISILEEMKALVQNTTTGSVVVLDNYDDGANTEAMLSIQTGLPDDRVSGNVPIGPNWLYARQIRVSKLPGQSSLGVRLVRVRLYKNTKSGQQLLAEVASVVRTLANIMPETQVFDIYSIAIENVPGWWVYMARIIPVVQTAINEMESRNPGLEFRTHWITKLSYGRDPYYRPYINQAADSEADINWVYFYPGTMPTGSAVEQYYPVSGFGAEMNVDGTTVNGYDASTNPVPYHLADQFNHGLRYPEESKLFNARVAAGLEDPTTPTFRLLIDDMVLNPAKYTNAIIINLHGELLPFPPTRNYSDAAKEPTGRPNVRVVTHPEKIAYANTEDVALRVYSYYAPSSAAGSSFLGTPISIVLKNVPSSAVSVDALTGGTNQEGTLLPYNWVSPAPTTSGGSNRMYATIGTTVDVEGTHTLVQLYNSPLIAPCVRSRFVSGSWQYTLECSGTWSGLRSDRQLYGMEYVPSPTEYVPGGEVPFTNDLTTTGGSLPNTARWRINITDAGIGVPFDDTMMEFTTRIGTDLTTGVRYPVANQPENLSTTYVWRGTDLWLYGDGSDANPPHMPMTERFQYVGDPRHQPYADNKRPHLGSGIGGENRLGMGYNRYFDDFHDSSGKYTGTDGYRGWSYTAGGQGYGVANIDNTRNNDGWIRGGDQIEVDMQRVFQTWRSALASSRVLYTTMTGFSYYYFGIGGEIGYDSANGFANSIPVSTKPFNGSSGSMYEQSITGSVRLIRENDSGYWWGVNWIGELYPDARYAGWVTNGNLPTGSGSGRFIRTSRQNVNPGNGFTLPPGTDFERGVRRTAVSGSTNFMWTGTSSSTFHHTFNDGATGSITGLGLEMNSATAGYNYPLLTVIPTSRPFNRNINDTGANPIHFLQPAYGAPMITREEGQYYQVPSAGNRPASVLYSDRDPATNRVAFLVVNGLSPTGAAGTTFIARWSFLSLVHGFMTAGLYTDSTTCTECPYSVKQLPRVAITKPNLQIELRNPTSIDVEWAATWKRWDDEKYTPAYSATYADTPTLSYYLMYSRDNGSTWRYLQDESLATPGTPPANVALRLTGNTYTWPTPAGTFPDGNYLLRVEGYRDDRTLHYSYHQFMCYLRRF